MSWQLWDPPAIIIPAPIQTEIKAEQKEQIPIDEHYKKVYDTAWNKLQPDGRINIDGESSASISPYSKHFRSQIEDRVWPLVELFYLKGYLPVSSCGGHRGTLLQEFERGFFEYSSCPYVMIAVNRDCEKSVLQSLEKTLYTDISVAHSMGNMDASKASEGKIVKSKRKNIKNEYESLNWMMQRNYDKWSYITIRINPWKRMSLKYVLRTRHEQKLINYVVEKYRNLPQYIF